MAQEAILNVSLKDYKKNIDELRGSLLGLEKDSEEYKKIAEELKDKQDKLNEVMSVGKEAVNAVDGSYNQLSATLSRLKKEWKNMEIGTPEWEAMAVRINDINNQLKDADSQVGVFTRNVGDYANAFEEAFKKATDGLATMPGVIGDIAGTAKQLIPLIQKTTATATNGLKGVKKAIAATGIGALIIAVGLLIANFDKLVALFKKHNSEADKAKQSYENLTKALDDSNVEMERQVKLMEAQGEAYDKINLYQRQHTRQALELIQIEKDAQTDLYDTMTRRSLLWRKTHKEEMEAVKNNIEELGIKENEYYDKLQVLNNDYDVWKIREDKKVADEEKKQLDDLLKKVKENSKSEIQALTDKYNEELALLKKYGKDTAELDKQYATNLKKIIEQTTDQFYSRLAEYDPNAVLGRNYLKASEEVAKFQEAVDRKFPPQGLIEAVDVTDEMITKAKELGLTIGNTKEDFALAYRLAYQDYKKLDEEILDSYFKQTEAYKKAEKALGNLKEGTSEWYQSNLALASSVSENIQKTIKGVKEKLRETRELYFASLDFGDAEGMQKAYEKAEIALKNLEEWEEALYNANKELDEAADSLEKFNNEQQRAIEIAKNETDILEKEFGKDSWTQWFSNTSQFYKIYDARLKAAEWYRDNLEDIEGETNEERKKRELEAEQAILQIKREYAKKQIEVSQTLSNGLISVWGSINDIRENNLKAQGKTDEKIFEKTKGSRIAQATVDTIAGSLASFMGWQEYPQPYAAIMGGIQAAATLAAGMAQIAQIRATQFNSAGQNISSPQAVVNATPRMSDYQPDLVSNITGASEIDTLKNALQETPIFVSVTDINAAQIKVTDRNKESSF